MKRWTETDKWRDPWFQGLPLHCKALWMWMCDNCDAAGVLQPDWATPSTQIGHPVSAEDLKHFERQIEVLPGGKLLILQFIPFQQGKLSRDSRGQTKVFQDLEKHGLLERYEKNQWLTPTPFKRQQAPPVEGQSELPTDSIDAFNRFWEAYPKKVSIYAAQQAFWQANGKEHIEGILKALEWQRVSTNWTKNSGLYIPNPAKYLSDGSWHDQKPAVTEPAAGASSNPSPGRAPLWAQKKAKEDEKERLLRYYEDELASGDGLVGETEAHYQKRMQLCKENRQQRKQLRLEIEALNQRIANGEN